MKKRKILYPMISLLFIGIVALLFFHRGPMAHPHVNMMGMPQQSTSALTVEEKSLPIPPLLKDENPDPNKAEFRLNVQNGSTEFFKGVKVNTMGYNGDYLGPVIRVHKGEDVSIHVNNTLDESTTLHWHGLEVDGKEDGGPHNGIAPKTTWTATFTIDQPASTLWYHPHFMQKTGEQVYKGLAGLFYIDDAHSDQLNIPKDYGVDDIPLVLQDRRFNSDGTFDYTLGMHDVMMGFVGNTLLVNGAIQPYLNVKQGPTRLRLVNGSNASIYVLHLNNNQSFTQIASDGGFLPKPVDMTELTLAPGERAEVIVDLSRMKLGESIYFMEQDTKFMKFVVTDQETKSYSIPSTLAEIKKIDPSTAARTRSFVFQGMGSNVNINGKQFNMDRIDEVLHLHDTEIWEISNDSGGMMGMAHPFHAHGVQFQILDRDGNPPPANESGWKDTILVNPGEKVRAIAAFDHSGLFMYHCHILEHEDQGMMGQFEVK